jgi:TolA-binding protein
MRRFAGCVALIVLVGRLACAEPAGQAEFDFANGLFQRGFYKEAAGEYRSYLEKYPEGEQVSSALYRLGESAYAAHDHEAALKAFDQLLARKPEGAILERATLSRAEVLYFLKKPADASIALELLAGEGSSAETRARALYYLGKVNAESNSLDAAEADFKKLIEALPDSPFVPYAQYQLALVYLARGNHEEAATTLSAVAQSSADEPLRAEARFRAAEAFDQIGWFDAAVQAYDQLKKDFPNSEYAERAEYGHIWALYHAAKYPESASASADFLKRKPDSPQAPGMKYLLGNALQQQRRYDEAMAVYKEIRADYAKSEFAARAQYKIAWCLNLAGRIEEAKAEISAFLQAPEPKMVGDAAFLLGTIMVSLGDYENAYEEFRLVSEKYADSDFGAEALYKGGECLAQLGRTSEAAKSFEQFAAKYPAHELTEQAMLRAGDAQFTSSAFAEAVGKYKQIIEGAPAPAVEQDTLYRLAITYHNMKDYESSAATFKTLLDKYPQTPRAAEAHIRIGDHYVRDAKDGVKAIESYTAALNLDPQGPTAGRAVKGLALARYETKDLDAACEMFLKLMNEYPSVALSEETYAWVGQRLYDQQKWDAAAQAFAALLKARPDYLNPERVRFKIAECSEAAGKPDEAIKLFQAVVDTAPQSAIAVDAKYRMATLHEARKKHDEAFKLFEEVANTNTGMTSTRARFHLGELYEAKGEFESAARSYMYVVIVFLNEELAPESLWRAGQCFEKAGSADQARKAYEELVATYPDSEQAGKAREANDKLQMTKDK